MCEGVDSTVTVLCVVGVLRARVAVSVECCAVGVLRARVAVSAVL